MSAIAHPAPVIRVAAPADFDAAGDVTELAFATGPYSHLPRRPERVRFERDVAARAADGEVLVAERDGLIVGAVSVLRAGTSFARRAREAEAELRLLAVAPDVQGGGVGRLLVAAAHEVALEWGVTSLVLDTGTRNTAARHLYERHGFERVSGGPSTPADPDAPIEHVAFRLGLQPDDGLVVRLALPHEYDEVAALSLRAYELDYEISEDYRASILAVGKRAAEHQVWIAADAASGALLGAVSTPRRGARISPLARPGELDFRLVAVDPSARGRGVGARLTRHVIELARLRGLDRVVMNSGPQMVGAHRLYERLGFTRLHEREREIVDGGRTFRLLAFSIDVDGAHRSGHGELGIAS